MTSPFGALADHLEDLDPEQDMLAAAYDAAEDVADEVRQTLPDFLAPYVFVTEDDGEVSIGVPEDSEAEGALVHHEYGDLDGGGAGHMTMAQKSLAGAASGAAAQALQGALLP